MPNRLAGHRVLVSPNRQVDGRIERDPAAGTHDLPELPSRKPSDELSIQSLSTRVTERDDPFALARQGLVHGGELIKIYEALS